MARNKLTTQKTTGSVFSERQKLVISCFWIEPIQLRSIYNIEGAVTLTVESLNTKATR